MSCRDVLQEDGTVDRLIASGAKANQGTEQSNCEEVWRASSSDASEAGNQEGNVESGPTANKVCCHRPKRRANQKPHVFSNDKVRGALNAEFVLDGRVDDGYCLQPELRLVSEPRSGSLRQLRITLSINQPRPVIAKTFHWKEFIPILMRASFMIEIFCS